MSLSVSLTTHGPFFGPERRRILARYCNESADAIAERGQNLIRAYLPTQYMYLGHGGGDPKHNPVPHDAGRYQAEIQTDRARDGVAGIGDDRVVYGPWLEGVSLRNFEVFPGRVRRGLSPRFPGHQAFRHVAQILDRSAPDIAMEHLPRYVEELNA